MTGEVLRWLRPLAMPAACGGAALTLALISTLLVRGAEVPLFVVHLMIAALVAGAAYLLDDPAAEATAVVPRSLLVRRLRAVFPGLAVTALAAISVAAVLRWRSPSLPLELLGWETLGLVGLALALSAVVFRQGEPEPGNLVASLLVLVVLGTLVGQRALPVDLLATGADGAVGAGWWTAMFAASTAVLVWRSLGGVAVAVTHVRASLGMERP
jgi:hypothetical protein